MTEPAERAVMLTEAEREKIADALHLAAGMTDVSIKRLEARGVDGTAYLIDGAKKFRALANKIEGKRADG